VTPESTWLVWAVIVVGGALTFTLRASFVFLLDHVGEIPPRLERALGYVPAAVLAGLVAPALFVVDGQLLLDPWNEQVLAAVAATLVAWKTENIFATIGVGMAVFWGIRFLA
jgi:branched-subunit amino acid transport protein